MTLIFFCFDLWRVISHGLVLRALRRIVINVQGVGCPLEAKWIPLQVDVLTLDTLIMDQISAI